MKFFKMVCEIANNSVAIGLISKTSQIIRFYVVYN